MESHNNNRRSKRRNIRRDMYKKTKRKGLVETVMGYFFSIPSRQVFFFSRFFFTLFFSFLYGTLAINKYSAENKKCLTLTKLQHFQNLKVIKLYILLFIFNYIFMVIFTHIVCV